MGTKKKGGTVLHFEAPHQEQILMWWKISATLHHLEMCPIIFIHTKCFFQIFQHWESFKPNSYAFKMTYNYATKNGALHSFTRLQQHKVNLQFLQRCFCSLTSLH